MDKSPQFPKKPRRSRDPSRIKLDAGGHPKALSHIPDGPKVQYTPEQFIDAYILHGLSITKACKELGCSRELHYGWLATNPAYVELFERARELFLQKAEAILDDNMENHISISELKRELKEDPRYSPQPEDTLDIIALKQKLFMGRIREAQELNAMAHDTAKFVAKMRGSKHGWKERQEVEHSGEVTLAERMKQLDKPSKQPKGPTATSPSHDAAGVILPSTNTIIPPKRPA